MVMLDTNILIRAIRQPSHPVTAKLLGSLGVGLCVSSVTWTELIYGVYRSANPSRNLLAVQQLLSGIPILPFDTDAATHAGIVMAALAKAGTPIGDRDALIAGHARALGVKLITHNVREFSRVPGLQVEDWLSENSS